MNILTHIRNKTKEKGVSKQNYGYKSLVDVRFESISVSTVKEYVKPTSLFWY
jgi:hypothetical protein